jgi:hypothetical protein
MYTLLVVEHKRKKVKIFNRWFLGERRG